MVAYEDPDYVRTRNVRAALKNLGGYRLVDATNKRTGWLRYLETLGKTIRARLQHNPEIYVLGFRGHEIFWFIRLIAIGKRLVFDEFMSPSDALLSENKAGPAGKLLGYLLYPLERMCLRFSGHCITDTYLHKEFIAQRFTIAEKKIDVVYVGATLSDLDPGPRPPVSVSGDSVNLNVLFYGTFLPLHGMDVILRACSLMQGSPMEFHIIGGRGRPLLAFRKLRDELRLGNVRHETWVDFEDLQSTIIPRADICLGGPFGGTPQARRVITGKTFQFLAQSRPTIVGRVNEPAGFIDRENCLLVEQASEVQLAKAFQWAIDNRTRLPEIGRNGHGLYRERFSPGSLARQMETALRATP